MKLNLGSGPNPLDGFVNLDKNDGWRFEDGLGDYPDGSVEAITISHALMYVALEDWSDAFAEFFRVLEPGGVIRITEDATDNPDSERYGGFPGATTLTNSRLAACHLEDAGFMRWMWLGACESLFRDSSLCQDLHGGEPKVFFIEGVKPC